MNDVIAWESHAHVRVPQLDIQIFETPFNVPPVNGFQPKHETLTQSCFNVGFRRRPTIKTTLGQCLVFAGSNNPFSPEYLSVSGQYLTGRPTSATMSSKYESPEIGEYMYVAMLQDSVHLSI